MDSGSIMLEVIILVILLSCSAYFSATETAFTSYNRAKMKNEAEDGGKLAALVLKLSEKFEKLLATVLIGNNIVNIVATSLSTVLFVSLIKNGELAVTLSTIVMTLSVLIFGEITPKTVAKRSPERYAKKSAKLLNGIIVLLTPLTAVFNIWQHFVIRMMHSEDGSGVTEDEIITVVEEAANGGEIDEQESELIKNAMELNENDAADIATPRVDVVAIPVDASKEEISSTFAESGYSRLPVYEETVDSIIGIIHQNDFYREINNPKINIHDIMKKPIFVPQTIKIGSLLKLLQHEKCHMAVVSDEYGGTYGIVTMEDVLEELVGEIWDEHDEVEEDFTKVSDGVYTVSGSADPEETLENLGIDKEVDCATMGGWVMDELNKIPEVGDTFDCEGYTVTVTAVDGMRAETIEIKKDSEKEAAEEKQ